MSNLTNQLRWYIAVRVVAIGSVLIPYALLQIGPTSAPAEIEGSIPPAPPAITAPAPQASPIPPIQMGPPAPPPEPEMLRPKVVFRLGGLTFAATLVYIALLRILRRRPTIQAYIQFFGDLLLITALVYYLGGIESPFSMLYLIVIAVASTLLRRRAGITVASAANVLYAGLVLSLYFHRIPLPPGAPETVPVFRLAYGLAVHCFGFYGVALLTSYLAHNVARAERELEEKREHLADLEVVHRDVIESISSGLITTDLEGVITSINQAGLSILERPLEELVGRPIRESGLFSPERWSELTAASESKRTLRAETEMERGGDTHDTRDTRNIGFSISQLNDADGRHRGFIVIFQDFSRWRKLEGELRIKDRMAAVGELAAGLAHEIGNPLAAISGSVQMLSSAPNATPSQRKLIEILLKESQRLDRTIKGFLRFARPREGSLQPFDIARLLAENCELLRNSAEVSELHRIAVKLDPPSASVIADPDQVSQIFWNLARNSLRAMPGGGTLTIVGKLTDEHYRMQVIDTGRGMTEEQRANLFHPFQSFFDGGTGIGMAIVYRIVQEHGGRLDVDSRPGGGTTITVELPAMSAGVSGMPAVQAAAAGVEAP
ncbi:MAG: two-component system, NtrC family, sensor histidine kinase PilS [Acidobacteriota bacterium]|jgi:two-component system sensor histidine kinase PilS (NtrC family)|nr:two-component system, NtrC family, sensor histidine kinase PilS [Acidobacteriota bacterium]